MTIVETLEAGPRGPMVLWMRERDRRLEEKQTHIDTVQVSGFILPLFYDSINRSGDSFDKFIQNISYKR